MRTPNVETRLRSNHIGELYMDLEITKHDIHDQRPTLGWRALQAL